MAIFQRVHHIGVVVDSLDDAKRLLGQGGIGLQLVTERDIAPIQRRLAFFQCGEVQIELIQPYSELALERELSGNKAKIEHIAVEVDDVRGALKALSSLGLRATSRGVMHVGDRETAWTDPDTSDGVMYQLVARRVQ